MKTMKTSLKFCLVLSFVILAFGCSLSITNDQPSKTANAGKTVLESAVPAVDPFVMVQRLGKAINLGNTLDAQYEGWWTGGQLIQEEYFDNYKAYGFNSVRIPVSWDKHIATNAPYAVDPVFMTRVNQVVDWALARNLPVVLNCHHEDWIRTNYPAAQIPRFEALWTQIAAQFANKSENLVFEVINEPWGPITKDQVNDLNSRALRIIRQNNPTRNVILSGREWNNADTMMTEVNFPNDGHLIANFHYYDPFWFTLGGRDSTWGTPAEISAMTAVFTKAKQWSTQKNIPIYIGEYGAFSTNQTANVLWYHHFCALARNNGFAYAAWTSTEDKVRYLTPEVRTEIMGPVVQSVNLPAKIEAENYTAMSGIQTEACAEGTLDVGWIDTGDWMDYSVNVQTAGNYTIEYRLASIAGTGKIDFRVNGTTLVSKPVPNTGGWQVWTTVTAAVNLSAGKQTIRLYASGAPFNVNWFNVKAGVVSSSSSSVSSKSSSKSSVASSSSRSSASSRSSSSSSSSSVGNVIDITSIPFVKEGKGEFWYRMTITPAFINSWNMDVLEINGVSLLNKWVSGADLPAKQNGYYNIHFKGSVDWSHFEAK